MTAETSPGIPVHASSLRHVGLGLVLPSPPAAGWRDLARTAGQAEADGAGSFWLSDHLYWGVDMIECLTGLALASGGLERCLLGSCVLQLPLRRPAVVAKAAATLQIASGGRFVLGVGAGERRDEFELSDVSFFERGRHLDEAIDKLRGDWAGDGAAELSQRPVPSSIPIWIGGRSRAARARVVRAGDGWIPLFMDPVRYGSDLATMRQELADHGRAPSDVVAAAVVMVAVTGRPAERRAALEWMSRLWGVGAERFAPHLASGSAEEVASRLADYRGAGADHLVVMMAGDDQVGSFAELNEAYLATV